MKLRRKERFFKLYREGTPNPFLESRRDEDGWVSTEEMLRRVAGAKLFATGPEHPIENRQQFYRMICKVNVSMRSRGVYEIKRHYHSAGHLRRNQHYRDRYFPGFFMGKMLVRYMMIRWQLNVMCLWTVQYSKRIGKDPF